VPRAWRTTHTLTWRQWEDADEWVVFHAGSGGLHLLNDSAARVLQVIEGQPHTLEALRARAVPGLAADPATLHDLLESLDRLGLIEPEGR
jgi:PqqD family protein of HPr-rel-A system